MATAVQKVDELIRLTEMKSDAEDKYHAKDAFVLVTKWPTVGKSKTRLSKAIGTDLAIDFSFAALKDLLLYYSKLNRAKFLLFAPKDAKPKFESLLKELALTNEYALVAMKCSNLKTSDLGAKLSGCIQDIRCKPHAINGSICFIGSDCLELRIGTIDIATKYTHPKDKNNAYIVPANDGGFVMVDLPPNASHKVFDNILWSNERTCETTIAAIKRCGIEVIKSNDAMSDVDELTDWIRLCKHFGVTWNEQTQHSKDKDGKVSCSNGVGSHIDYTKKFPKVATLLKQIDYTKKQTI
eukprot:77766_1